MKSASYKAVKLETNSSERPIEAEMSKICALCAWLVSHEGERTLLTGSPVVAVAAWMPPRPMRRKETVPKYSTTAALALWRGQTSAVAR